MTKRPYTQRKRAEARGETRRRIVEAAMHLHEEVGPAATTISAIAERAGVQRLTVYRHFPDEAAIFQACTAHWLGLNPPPDAGAWAHLDGAERVRAALLAFSRYYGATRTMWEWAHRDEARTPAIQGPMDAYRDYLDGASAELARGLPAGTAASRKRAAATVRHLLDFQTWRSLDALGLSERQIADLGQRWIEAAAA